MRISALVPIIIVLLLGGASVWLNGPLPLDIEITRSLQGVIPAQSQWIGWLSVTAGWPAVLISALVFAVFAASLAGLRGAAAALGGMMLAMAAERGLRLAIFVPRPSPELVDVATASASSGLPSTFAIFYGAACGALVLLAWTRRGREAKVVRWAAIAVLIIGCTGRVAAGGHWSSQVLASAALGWLASLLMVQVMRVLPGRR